MYFKLWQLFTAPHPSLTDETAQRKARLISAMTLIAATALIIGSTSALQRGVAASFLIAIALMLGTYALSRTPFIEPAGILLLAILTIPSLDYFITIARDQYSTDVSVYAGMIWLTLPIALSGLILSSRNSAFYSGGLILVLTTFKLVIVPSINNPQFWNSWAFLLTLSITVVLSSIIREIYLVRPQIKALLDVQEQLRERNEELLRADQVKDEFLATMSHELRTPLNSVIGYSSILLNGLGGELDDEAMTIIQSIETSSQHLLSLITDILDISKIGAGKVEIRLEPVEVGQLTTDWEQAFSNLAQTKGIALYVQVADSVPETVRSDAGRLTQIVTNLLSNAIKFTNEGFVSLLVGSDGENLILRVQDTGIGIPEDQLDLIFEKFRQANANANRIHEGTGLGLAITKRLVELLGGSITVNSEIGRGTQFTVKLPHVEQSMSIGVQG